MTTTDNQATQGVAPTHVAYQVTEAKESSYWTRIGAAWAHKDGKGFSIQLNAFPADARVMLRLATEQR